MRPSTILVRRIGGALWPSDEKSTEMVRKVPLATTVPLRLLRERNHEQLALYWRVLERVVEATGRWHCADELHLALKIATGRIDEVTLIGGRRVLVPDSIAFHAMSQDEFQLYLNDAFKVLCNEVLGGITVEELLEHTDAKKAA
jgi:hypothetical protein